MLQLFIELPVRKTQNHFKANIYYWKFLWISILSISVTRIEIWYFDNLRFKQCHFRKYSPKKNHHLFFHILEIALSRIGKDSMHLFIWWKTHYICSLFSGKSNSVAKWTWIYCDRRGPASLHVTHCLLFSWYTLCLRTHEAFK